VSTYRYEIDIWWSDEDSAFIAAVPELPGCMADGSSYSEALKAAQVAIDQWVETSRQLGRVIPESRKRGAFAS
jgi:predicted RNase H-like HicB family nuclease